MADIIQIRRDTAANWTSVNPVLAQGEFAVETDTAQMKIGDGVGAWSTLPYLAAGPTGADGADGPQGPQGVQGPAGNDGADGADGSDGASGITYTTKTADYTLGNSEGIIADTSGGTFVATLPATPSLGAKVIIADGDDWSTTPLTVGRNGSTIEGLASDLTLDVGGIQLQMIYDGTTWQLYPATGTSGSAGGPVTLDQVTTAGNTTTNDITVGSLTSTGIGIGTPTPSGDLHVFASGGGEQFISSSNSAMRFVSTGGVNYIQSGTATSSSSPSDLIFTNVGGSGETMRIDALGNVGIGTIPNAWRSTESALQLPDGVIYSGDVGSVALGQNYYIPSSGGSAYQQTGVASDYYQYQGGHYWRTATSGTAGSAVSWSETMRVDASGNALFGTTTTTINETNFGTRIAGAANPGYIASHRNASGSQACTILGGNVGEFQVMGDGACRNTNNSYGGISDARLKSNIVDASPQLDDIMSVQMRSYTLNETGETHIGVVAQELEAAGMSGLVKTDDDGIKSVKYSILYLKAIKAMQEQQAMIEALQARVATLEGGN